MVDAAETKRQKAKQLRYRKPIGKALNLESSYQWVYLSGVMGYPGAM